jgi:hypothetical protein
MPKTGIRQNFDLQTRDRYTKVECEIGLSVNGRELPNMEVLGKALEAGIAVIQESIANSYKVVPERVEGGVSLTEDQNAVSAVTPKPTEPVQTAQPPIPSFGS